MPGVIIPRKCVAGTAQAARRGRRHGRIRCPTRRSAFGLGNAVLTSKLIDGTFPITPGSFRRERQAAAARSAQLRAGRDRVSTIASERTRAVKMTLDRDRVTLSVTSPENGTASEEVAADYAAGAIEIGFNARYLLDILHQIEGDSVEVHLADAAAPTLLRENDKAPALYVLMPMRV
jgi:DNA polymerase-3 subunit beta